MFWRVCNWLFPVTQSADASVLIFFEDLESLQRGNRRCASDNVILLLQVNIIGQHLQSGIGVSPARTAIVWAFSTLSGPVALELLSPCRALDTLTNLPTVTDDDIRELPWAQPGYRGAYVSAQPPAVQSAIIAGMHVPPSLLLLYTLHSDVNS